MARDRIMILTIINIIICIFSSADGVSSVSVSISPQHVHVSTEATTKITCYTTPNISRCEFKVLDLTNANTSLKQGSNLYLVYEEHYPGKQGLISGECAFTLYSQLLMEDHYYVTTCRVRSATSDWSYASMSLYKSEADKFPLVISKPEVVVLPGGKLEMSIYSNLGGHVLSSCSFKHLPFQNFIELFSTRHDCSNYYCFYGAAEYAYQRTCGITINSATEDDNGFNILKLEANAKREISFIRVIVAKPPNPPELQEQLEVHENGSMTLHATCTVTGSRPAAIVTWSLGGITVSDEYLKSLPNETWMWPSDDQTLRQRLQMKLNASHVGKEIRCSATNLALNVTLDDAFRISKISTPTTAPAATQPTSNGYMSTSSSISGKDREGRQYEDVENHMDTWLYVIIWFLVVILLLVITLVVVYAWRKALCCFARSKDAADVTVKYRRSLDATFKMESGSPAVTSGHVHSPGISNEYYRSSSVDRSSAVTGLEYAEIRVSMVQRCVDKMATNPSVETGAMQEDTLRPNSLYESCDQKPQDIVT